MALSSPATGQGAGRTPDCDEGVTRWALSVDKAGHKIVGPGVIRRATGGRDGQYRMCRLEHLGMFGEHELGSTLTPIDSTHPTAPSETNEVTTWQLIMTPPGATSPTRQARTPSRN